MNENIHFYKVTSGSLIQKNEFSGPNEKISLVLFRPSITKILPKGIIKISFLIWWVFWVLGFFKRDYFIGIAFNSDKKFIHHFVILPKFFKYPFMGEDDLQIGDVWTHPSYRGFNLSAFAISSLIEAVPVHYKSIWYITEAENKSSIKVANKLKFNFSSIGYVKRQSYYWLFKTNMYYK